MYLANTPVQVSPATPSRRNQASGATVSDGAVLVLHKLVPLTLALMEAPHDDGGAAGVGGAGGADGAAGAGGAGGPEGGATDATDATDALKANGQPCGAGDECESTLCVDGVCCASACNTLCQTCNLPGKVGTCAPVPAGNPRHRRREGHVHEPGRDQLRLRRHLRR